MMYSAKQMSDAIRMKRKKVKEDGVENMVDTDSHPQMNPQDIYNDKLYGQVEATLESPEKSMAPDDPADADIAGTSQELAALKMKMAKVRKILAKLSMSDGE